MAESFTNRLLRFFNLKTQTTNTISKDKAFVPAEVVKSKDGTETFRKVKLPDAIQKLWNWYESQTSDSSETLKNRFDRYDDIDYMIYNDPIISMAVDLYADEASQADVQTEPIGVEAKRAEVRNTIRSLLEQWGVDQTHIREVAWNLAAYGDAFDIPIITEENGIENLEPQDVRTVVDRIEFKATEVAKKMKGDTGRYINREPRLKTLVKQLSDKTENYASYFKSYLMGFQLEGDMFLPPWAVCHYRNFSRKSEFWPFGRSMFIYSIAPFRQLKTGKNLMALSRALKFPKDKYEVKVSENMTEVEQWEAVNEARQEMQNLGVLNQQKDEFSVGGEIWIPEGLINHQTIESNLRIEDIADIELLRDDMIMGTRIPKGYLVVDRSSFGTSGQSLLQQHKPFGRAVYSIQSVILEQLTRLIKMHFLMTGQFDKEFTEFQLTMNFPVIEEAQDRLRMKNDTLRLAADVISNIQSALGTRDGLPPDVVEMIFSKLSFLDPDDVKEIMKKTIKGLNLDAPDASGAADDMFASVKFDEETRKRHEKIRSRINEEVIYTSYFDTMRENGIQEGVFNSKHVRFSSKVSKEEEHLFSLLRLKEIEDLKG